MRSLLGWVQSGFSVHGEQTVPTEDVQGAERLAVDSHDHGTPASQKHSTPGPRLAGSFVPGCADVHRVSVVVNELPVTEEGT